MDHTSTDDDKAWMKLINEDPNAVWGHATSIADKRQKDDVLAEIDYIRELFTCYLPTDQDNLSEIHAHLDKLKDHATNGEPLGEDQFGSDDNDDPEKRDYRYFSASLFKERSSQPPLLAGVQDLGNTSDQDRPRSPPQDHHQGTADLPPIPECADTEGSQEQWSP